MRCTELSLASPLCKCVSRNAVLLNVANWMSFEDKCLLSNGDTSPANNLGYQHNVKIKLALTDEMEKVGYYSNGMPIKV